MLYVHKTKNNPDHSSGVVLEWSDNFESRGKMFMGAYGRVMLTIACAPKCDPVMPEFGKRAFNFYFAFALQPLRLLR